MGCKRENKGWDIDGLIPLVNSNLNLQNLFEDSIIQPDQNKLLRIVYREDFLNFRLDDDFVIPDTTIFTSNRLTCLVAPPLTCKWYKRAPLISDTNSSRINIKNVNLTYARVKSGSIIFKVRSSITEPIIATYTMPIATKDGKELRISEVIPAAASSSTPTVIEKEIDLAGYLLDLRGKRKNDYNTIQFFFEVVFQNPTTPDSNYVYNSNDYVNIENTFTQVVPEYGKGVFLTQTIQSDEPDKTGFDAFKNFFSGSLILDEAKFNFVFENYVGADLTAKINKLIAVNDKTGKNVAMTGEVIGKSINVGRAKEDFSLTYPHIIPQPNLFALNDKNSNVLALLENQPTYFDYLIDFTINPLGNVSGGNDFIYNGYGVKASIDVEIPLCVKAENLLLIDTTDFAPGTKEEDLNSIKGGNLMIYCDNSYPLSAKIKVDLLDENGKFLMTLLQPKSEIKAGIMDDKGIVRSPLRSVLMAPITPAILDQFYLAKKAVVYLTFNTPTDNPVKLYSFYNSQVKIVGDVQYNVVVK